MSVDDFTADEVLAAIGLALKARDMPAVVDLMHVLAVKDPASAETILAVIDLARVTPWSQPHPAQEQQ